MSYANPTVNLARLKADLSLERYAELEELVACVEQARAAIAALDVRGTSNATVRVLNSLPLPTDAQLVALADALEQDQSADDADAQADHEDTAWLTGDACGAVR